MYLYYMELRSKPLNRKKLYIIAFGELNSSAINILTVERSAIYPYRPIFEKLNFNILTCTCPSLPAILYYKEPYSIIPRNKMI